VYAVGFECSAFRVKIMMDVDVNNGQAIIMAPIGTLDFQQIREVQRVLETRRIILIHPVERAADAWEKNLRSA
jgi:hypothetical protein